MTRQATAQRFPRSRPGRRSRLLVAVLAIPLLVGLFAAPVSSPSPVRGDESSADAQAQQRALQKKIADQKALISQLNNSQANLQGAIKQTRDQLDGITDDLAATRKRVARLIDDIGEVRATYQTLVYQLSDLNLQVQRIEAKETAKKVEASGSARPRRTGSAMPTRPSGRRSWRPSCPGPRSRTCSPR